MLRLFTQHKVRKVEELNGNWEFSVDGKKTISMPVPGCWEQHPEYANYRGKATYTKKIYTNDPSSFRLEFKGVSHTAEVYFDGEKVIHHYNAYTPFSCIIPSVKAGNHEIKVVVDNSFTQESALHIPNDYYTYGGLIRGVCISPISDVYIERIQFTPEYKDNTWWAKTEVFLYNTSQIKRKVSLDLLLADQNETITETIPANSRSSLSIKRAYPRVESWSATAPSLYLLQATLLEEGKEIDDLIERVGFRTVEVKGNQLYLNDEKVFLKGFNRHEDHGPYGCAIPYQLMVQDMDIIQDLGGNSIRTCHYPNDELFLDLCDERGMLVWEENHARGFDLEKMQNPHFDKQCFDCNKEMVESHYNHPSIIIWGILNECASETEIGRSKYKKQYQQIRAMDRSRPLTSATCRHFTDKCLDLPDIVSFNMYTGWYQDMSVSERHDQELAWIEQEGGAGKPIIVSEFGAGGIYGFRDRAKSKWSEERQREIIEANMKVYLNDPRIMGVYIWQFADCRVTEEDNWFAVRPRTHNNKGIVDEYRRPKLVYDTVKQYFNR
ncbi:MAG: glycoside hydrolase family 2 TIM barrel-domain containing protein [Enterococcus casseliflavus]|jgi:Beta-galactosidase/beta-glucuronidase|nr:glycoside hydrolase family 2 TIM barrel-domain containing protein [Enterococcus casseliflavus]